MPETARLLLEPWEERHWRELQPIAADAEVMRYISGKPWPEERVREFVSRQMACFAERGFCMWRAIGKGSGGMIGFCGIQPLRGTDDIEIGWWLAREHWGRGLATEAAREALRFAFAEARLDRVVAVARPENARSLRVMEKIGLRWERDWVYQGVNVVLYARGRARGTGPVR